MILLYVSKPKFYFIFIIISATIILAMIQTVNAQLANSPIAKTINEKYGHRNVFNNATKTNIEIPATVYVNYESPSTVLISGGLINSIRGNNTFNYQLWEAMDLLKSQHGFHVQQVMPSGVGSVANPTVVYILMTK